MAVAGQGGFSKLWNKTGSYVYAQLLRITSWSTMSRITTWNFFKRQSYTLSCRVSSGLMLSSFSGFVWYPQSPFPIYSGSRRNVVHYLILIVFRVLFSDICPSIYIVKDPSSAKSKWQEFPTQAVFNSSLNSDTCPHGIHFRWRRETPSACVDFLCGAMTPASQTFYVGSLLYKTHAWQITSYPVRDVMVSLGLTPLPSHTTLMNYIYSCRCFSAIGAVLHHKTWSDSSATVIVERKICSSVVCKCFLVFQEEGSERNAFLVIRFVHWNINRDNE